MGKVYAKWKNKNTLEVSHFKSMIYPFPAFIIKKTLKELIESRCGFKFEYKDLESNKPDEKIKRLNTQVDAAYEDLSRDALKALAKNGKGYCFYAIFSDGDDNDGYFASHSEAKEFIENMLHNYCKENQ